MSGVTLSCHLATRGIPEGSVLGPSDQVHSQKFAEDSRLYGSFDLLKGRKTLKRDLDSMDRWAKANSLSFSKMKCWVLHFSDNNLM